MAWPSCRYGPHGACAVFECEDDVPEGWHDHPSKVGNDPLDHDGDGTSGGSVRGYHSTASKGARNRRKKADV